MPTLLHIARIRDVLLANTQIYNIVGDNFYPSHISDVSDPIYPNITAHQREGSNAAWAPGVWDPANVMLQFLTQQRLDQAHQMYQLANSLLHLKKTELSNAEICFHEIREVWMDSGTFDQTQRAWIVSARYLIRASVI